MKLPLKELEKIIDQYGLQNGWLNISYTHILNHKNKLIANNKDFQKAKKLDKDILEGLEFNDYSIMYEYSLAYSSKELRKANGQYFTPTDAAQLIARQSKHFPEGKWLDLCSGISNLSYMLISEQENKKDFLKNNLLLGDLDATALQLARIFLNLEYGDEHTYENTRKNYIQGDLLNIELPEHDYVISNPPYARTEENTKFKTSKTKELYSYFIEKGITTSKGGIFVTPESYTHGKKFKKLREVIDKETSGFDIMCFDNMPNMFFDGHKHGNNDNTNKKNSTRAAVLVFGHSKTRRITPLLKWSVKDREKMLSTAEDHLTEIPKGTYNYPKISRETRGLYEDLIGCRTLSDFISVEPTKYKLVIASSPRYYISAVKRDLSRSSFIEIYFKTLEDYNKMYLYLNSSIIYWWWRANDGGMTLSRETLLSLPTLHDGDFSELNKYDMMKSDLVRKVELSEKTNLVSTLNANKRNENVKHNASLVRELTELFFPAEVNDLLFMHRNSSLK